MSLSRSDTLLNFDEKASNTLEYVTVGFQQYNNSANRKVFPAYISDIADSISPQ